MSGALFFAGTLCTLLGLMVAILGTETEQRYGGIGVFTIGLACYAAGAFVWSGAIKDDLNEATIRKMER